MSLYTYKCGICFDSIDQIIYMKAIILLATLKKQSLSNTQTLAEFLSTHLKAKHIDVEIIKLVDYNILPGTYNDMGEGDEWPGILKKILNADIIIFATPIWWGSHSSEMQKVIERLDNLHDEILGGKKSRLHGKVGGIVITGDSDGGEQLIGIISNFFNAIGILLPPYATLTVLAKEQEKDAKTTRVQLMQKYRSKQTSKEAKTMAAQIAKYAAIKEIKN